MLKKTALAGFTMLFFVFLAENAAAVNHYGFKSCTNTAQHGCRPDRPMDSQTELYLRNNSPCPTTGCQQADLVTVGSTLSCSQRYWGEWTWISLVSVWTFGTGGNIGSNCGGGGDDGGGSGGGGGGGLALPFGCYAKPSGSIHCGGGSNSDDF